MPTVSLRPIASEEESTLANLLELYCHDLSIYFPVHVGANGRFGYKALPSYFASDPRRFAYFTWADGKLAGFVLATRGSPVATREDALDVAEFFVLRSYRKQGVGEQAAGLLWNTVRGHWTVRVATSNQPALAFWRRAVQRYTGKTPDERVLMQGGTERVVLELDSH